MKITCIMCLLVLIEGAHSQGYMNGGVQQDDLMSNILGSMEELRHIVGTKNGRSSLSVNLDRRLNKLRAQMETLSAELSALNTRFNGATETSLKLFGNVARATKSNSRVIDVLRTRLGRIEDQIIKNDGSDCGNPSSQTVEHNGKDKLNKQKTGVVTVNQPNKGEQILRKDERNIENRKEEANSDVSIVQENIKSTITNEAALTPQSKGHTKEANLGAGIARANVPPNISTLTTSTSTVEVASRAPSKVKVKSNKTKTSHDLKTKDHPHRNDDWETHEDHHHHNDDWESHEGHHHHVHDDDVHLNNREMGLMLRKVRKATQYTLASRQVLTQMSKRIAALEKYASPHSGALVNATKRFQTGLQHLGQRQNQIYKDMARKITNLEHLGAVLNNKLNQKQEPTIVDTSSALIHHKYLNDPIRVRFKQKFNVPPEVYAAISGFAMDPEHASLKSDFNETIVQELHDTHIFAVQTNFYTVRVEEITNIDTSGFSIKVYDGTDLFYSKFQWIQIQWIAIGK